MFVASLVVSLGWVCGFEGGGMGWMNGCIFFVCLMEVMGWDGIAMRYEIVVMMLMRRD